jgi:DNA-binding MarR family transcriptional regulator
MAKSWGFLTNHALVLVFVVRHGAATVREIASAVGITERATLAILRRLSDERIVHRRKEGRRTTYTVDFGRLAAYRRAGTVALTPREFVDALIRTLLALSHYDTSRNGTAGELDSGGLDPRIGTWGFFTNHALLLLAVAMDHQATVREIAASIGVTERAVVAILNQLEEDAIIIRRKQGRRNFYAIDFDALRAFPRWSPVAWTLPPELIDTAVEGLRTLAARGLAGAGASTPGSPGATPVRSGSGRPA